MKNHSLCVLFLLCRLYSMKCSWINPERVEFPIHGSCPKYENLWGKMVYTVNKGDFCSGARLNPNKPLRVKDKPAYLPTCHEKIFPVVTFVHEWNATCKVVVTCKVLTTCKVSKTMNCCKKAER